MPIKLGLIRRHPTNQLTTKLLEVNRLSAEMPNSFVHGKPADRRRWSVAYRYVFLRSDYATPWCRVVAGTEERKIKHSSDRNLHSTYLAKVQSPFSRKDGIARLTTKLALQQRVFGS